MIVVGIDGSESSAEALRWALGEAQLRKTDVLGLHAWTMPAPPGRLGFYAEPLQDPEPYREGAEKLVESVVGEVAAGGDVRVEHRAVQGSAGDVLVQASEGADLLVVGSRGHGGFTGLLLGSVSQQCVTHAKCPVVVLRRQQ